MRVPPRGRDKSKLQQVHPNKNTPDAEQVLDFIHSTIETLNDFKNHFEKHQLIELTHSILRIMISNC